MTEAARRAEIQRWFNVTKPELPTGAALIGALMVLTGYALRGLGVFGFLLLFAGILVLGVTVVRYQKARSEYGSRPSLDAMKQWLEQDFAAYKLKSLSGFGLNPSELLQESAQVIGPISKEARRVNDADEGSRWLFKSWRLATFHFTRGTLAVYQCTYDWYHDAVTGERRESIDYHHIITVRTEINSVGTREFLISLSNGHGPKVYLSAKQHVPINEQELNDLADRATQAVHTAKRNSLAMAVTPSAIPMDANRFKFCSNCGRSLLGSEKFCPSCGGNLGT